jgi:hypothetical protein
MAHQAHDTVSSVEGDNTTVTSTAPSASNGPGEIGDIPVISDASTVEKEGSSWKSSYKTDSPPAVQRPYKPEEALDDIPGVAFALEHFLSSHMLESEEYCNKMDETKCVTNQFQLSLCNIPTRERLYFATGYGLIQCVKGIMSYEDEVRCFKDVTS